jgi:arylsulfatase A-like enzyme
MIRPLLGWTARLCLVAILLTARTGLAADKPNVVVIFTDDQGTLDAGCYGSTDLHTPAMDRLAARGIRFTKAYAHSVCCPSRAMLLTGRHPQRSDVNSWMQGEMHGPKGRNMLTREVTLAEVLRKAGYRTALFGKWHLGAHPDHGPTRQGFDEFFGTRNGFIDNYTHFQLHRDGFHDLYEGTTEVFQRGSYYPDLITDRALAFIAQNYDRPFFLYYALNIPHYPEQALERHRARYKELPEPRRSYAAMISTTDDYVGRILTQLEAFKLLDRTIVVFMSDNGHSEEDFSIVGNHHLSGYPKGHNYGANGGGGNTGPWIGAKGSFLEGGIRVPAILSYPGHLPEGAVRDQAITVMDWYPTLLELTGVRAPRRVRLDGHSVLPLIADPTASSAYKVFHYQWRDAWMVREGDWKLIGNGTKGIHQPELDPLHLARLTDVKPEATNHAEEQPEVVARLKRLHEEWLKEVLPTDLPSSTESLP